jgi:hypothetical protein
MQQKEEHLVRILSVVSALPTKLHAYAGTQGEIVGWPQHPATWFKVKLLRDGKVLSMRCTAFTEVAAGASTRTPGDAKTLASSDDDIAIAFRYDDYLSIRQHRYFCARRSTDGGDRTIPQAAHILVDMMLLGGNNKC